MPTERPPHPTPARCRRWVATLLVLVCTAAPLAGAADERPWLTVRHWRKADGLPENNVNVLAQTPDGYLWIGNYGGLVRFDGRRFELFNHSSTPALPSDRVVALAVTTSGDLWFATDDGWVGRFDRDRVVPVPLPGAPSRSPLVALGVDEHDDVWSLDREGVVTRLRDGRTAKAPDRERNPRGPTLFARDPGSGKLYLLHCGLVANVAADGLQALQVDADPAVDTQMIGAASRQGIWVATTKAVRRFDGKAWAAPDRILPAANTGITGLVEQPDGTLAFATSTSGIHLLDPRDRVRQFSGRDDLGDNWVRALLVDREGSLWAGTAIAGIASIRADGFQLVPPRPEWDLRAFKSVTPRRAGGVWAGTEGDGLYRWDPRTGWERFRADAGLWNLFVWTALDDGNGRVWTGTWGSGLFVFERGRFFRVPGLADDTASIASLLAARDGSIWIGTTKGLWRHRPGGAVERYEAAHGLANADIRAIAETPDGSVWFGLVNGELGRWHNGEIELRPGPGGRTHQIISALAADERGGLWIGTTNSGLFRHAGGRFTSFDERQGLSRRTVSSIDVSGNDLWLATPNGILCIPLAELDAVAEGRAPRVKPKVFGLASSASWMPLASGAQPTACRTPDGVLWFATTEGLYRLDPTFAEEVPMPKPLIEEVTVDGRALDVATAPGSGTAFRIAPGSERIEIRFTAPSFKNQDTLRFRYRLRGEDRDWVEAGTNRTAYYRRLPPADYAFELEVGNGRETARIARAFTVQPTFWERRSVRLAGYLCAAAVIAGVVQLRARALHRRRIGELRHQQALDRERTRIARDIHDDLGASLTRISLMAQSAQRELGHPADATRRLDQVYRTARQLTHKMDEIVWAVSPRHDTLESVAHYLVSFAQELLTEAGIACRLDVPASLPGQPVFAEARHNVFLAFQEAVHNVVKHSRATRVSIALRTTGGSFLVVVEDNGVGVPATKAGRTRTGNGLPNMERRLVQVGGSCTIEPVATGGTRVLLEVPFARPESTETSTSD